MVSSLLNWMLIDAISKFDVAPGSDLQAHAKFITLAAEYFGQVTDATAMLGQRVGWATELECGLYLLAEKKEVK